MLSSDGFFRHGDVLRVRGDRVAVLLVGAAIVSSSIVFSEPAVADLLMLGAIVGLPMLGTLRIGTFTAINLVLWLAIVGLSFAAAGLSPTPDTAVKHQLITLFLVLGSVVIAGFVAGDPIPRFQLIMWCYLAACLLATAAAVAGYFELFPGAYDLFTSYGRARGTFKDPNVYGAALAPALAFVGWHVLRAPWPEVRRVAMLGLPLLVGLLLCFSRGAWFAAVMAIAILFAIAVLRARRRDDFNRFGVVVASGLTVLGVGFVVLVQFDQVWSLLVERFSLVQSYDEGPDGRFGGQAKALMLALDHPFGIGTHTFRELHHHEEPHNVYLSMFLNAGWLGGLFYLSSVVLTIVVGLRIALRNSSLQGPLLVAVAGFTGVALEGAIIDTDHWRHYFLAMGLVWGLVDAQPPLEPARRRSGNDAG